MRASDLRRKHCDWPVKITKLFAGPKSDREHLEFKCEHCGYTEIELRASSGALLQWRCTNVGSRHESRRAIAV